MKLADFNYDLPADRIAQRPVKRRDRARLMVLDRSSSRIEHAVFSDLPRYLNCGDVTVVNNTRVMPARLKGVKESNNAKVEVLLLQHREQNVWEVLAKPAKRLTEGTKLSFGGGKLNAEVVSKLQEGRCLVSFSCDQSDLTTMLHCIGLPPLPPYIKRGEPDSEDSIRYQTVYAQKEGAVAAPTAGLHFTRELLDQLRDKGVTVVALTLHIGYGTFHPVTAPDVHQHRMESEYYDVPAEAGEKINNCPGRVVAVGTSAVRTLETVMQRAGNLCEHTGWTDLYICPGYQFKAVDALITNFHLPRSTNLVLTAAFAGAEFIRDAYQVAIKEKYRFYSYGDAMLIL